MKWIVAQLSDDNYQWSCTFFVPAWVPTRGAKGKRKKGTAVYDSYAECKLVCNKLNRKSSGWLN
jgi:hypothetical protein